MSEETKEKWAEGLKKQSWQKRIDFLKEHERRDETDVPSTLFWIDLCIELVENRGIPASRAAIWKKTADIIYYVDDPQDTFECEECGARVRREELEDKPKYAATLKNLGLN